MKKAISIFLSMLMLASSSGIAYAQHFCGGMEMMAGITLGQQQLSCGMDADIPTSNCDDTDITDHGCCDNNFTKIQTDDNFAKAFFDLKLDKTFIATFFSVFVLHELEIASTAKTSFADYSPPPLLQDLNILYETFLI